MNLLVLGAVLAAGAGGAYLVVRARERGSAPAAPARPLFRAISLRKAPTSLPDLPGLRERELAEPGFTRELLKVIRETGADADKLTAYMALRSRFRPDYQDSHTKGFSNWHGGVGIFGFAGGQRSSAVATDAVVDPSGDLSAWNEFEPSAAEYVKHMTATEQVQGPLRDLLLKHPAVAKDPAVHILLPFAGATEVMPGGPPVWTEAGLAAAPDSLVIIEQPFVNMNPMAHATPWDEATWPELGNFDGDKDGIVTLGDIRGRYYGALSGTGRFKP